MKDYDIILEVVKALITQAVIDDQINEQWFLDWMDNLNKLSVSV